MAADESGPAIESSSVRGAATRTYTSKQMGDACEMLVAAELTLAGIPALKVPDSWPHYDVIAQPIGGQPARISVKARTYKRGSAYVEFKVIDEFDWLAIVLLPGGESVLERIVYVIPRGIAEHLARRDKTTSKTALLRYYRIDEVDHLFGIYRNNFRLAVEPGSRGRAAHLTQPIEH